MKIQLELLRRRPKILETVFETREYEMFDTVHNKEKDEIQLIIGIVPKEKRELCDVSKHDNIYICTRPGTNIWSVEYARDLRPATIFERGIKTD